MHFFLGTADPRSASRSCSRARLKIRVQSRLHLLVQLNLTRRIPGGPKRADPKRFAWRIPGGTKRANPKRIPFAADICHASARVATPPGLSELHRSGEEEGSGAVHPGEAPKHILCFRFCFRFERGLCSCNPAQILALMLTSSAPQQNIQKQVSMYVLRFLFPPPPKFPQLAGGRRLRCGT